MAKKLRPIIGAVVVGSIIAFIIFKSIEENTLLKAPTNAIAVQLGVFKTSEAALDMKKQYGGEIFEENGIYRLYYSILSRDDNIEFITNYLKDKNVNYYLKPIDIDEEALLEGQEYEKVMEKSKLDVRMSLNVELLNMYKDVV